MRAHDLAIAVRPEPGNRAGGMFADKQVVCAVIGHSVALVRRSHDFRYRPVRRPFAANVRRHVREEQMLLCRVPDRPFGEGEACSQLQDRRVDVDQFMEPAVDRGVSHSSPLFRWKCRLSAPRAGSSGEPLPARQRLDCRPRHGRPEPADHLPMLNPRRPVMDRQQEPVIAEQFLDGGLLPAL